MIQVNKNELYINGMTNKVDTINSIIDNIDNNDLDTAKDSLNQLKEVEEKKPIQSELDFKNADVNNPDFEKYAGRYGKSVKEWKDKGDK